MPSCSQFSSEKGVQGPLAEVLEAATLGFGYPLNDPNIFRPWQALSHANAHGLRFSKLCSFPEASEIFRFHISVSALFRKTHRLFAGALTFHSSEKAVSLFATQRVRPGRDRFAFLSLLDLSGFLFFLISKEPISDSLCPSRS